MKNTEIEIQLQIENSKPLMRFLKTEAEFASEKHQIDEYYSPAHRDFASKRPISEWLRIRDNGGHYSIDYKFWHRDALGKTNHCDEYGCSIGEIDQIKNIFKALNFYPVVRVEKIRKIYNYQNYEIAIDHVIGLGDFVEIEYKGKSSKTPEIITQEMLSFIKKIGVGRIKRNFVGYAFMLLAPKEKVQTEEY